jgi:hypothetical protein
MPSAPARAVRHPGRDAGDLSGAAAPWCPLPEGGLRIEDCYRGEDCWMGAYNGASAHGGLDINHAPGTPLRAPIDIDDHYYFNSLAMGHSNNRWRGIHRWPDGSEWILQAHHMTELTVPEHRPIRKGEQFAWGAGVHSGVAHHSHFVFKVHALGRRCCSIRGSCSGRCISTRVWTPIPLPHEPAGDPHISRNLNTFWSDRRNSLATKQMILQHFHSDSRAGTHGVGLVVERGNTRPRHVESMEDGSSCAPTSRSCCSWSLRPFPPPIPPPPTSRRPCRSAPAW